MSQTLLDWIFDKDNPPDDNDDLTMFLFHYNKTGKFVKTPLTDQYSIHSLFSSTTHSKNTDNIENKENITPSPPTSHKTDISCTNQVMANKYISIGPSRSSDSTGTGLNCD